MHIIFGKEQADQLEHKYTVLELDTFRFGTPGTEITAYCTIENVPFTELSSLSAYKKQHSDLLINYKLRNWKACSVAVNSLKGRWGGELDSFYEDIGARVNKFILNEPPADWSPAIQK